MGDLAITDRVKEVEESVGGLWRHGDFLKFWIGQSVSLFGSQISEIATPLIAVIMLQCSAGDMGLLKAVESLPWLLFGLLAGVWVDRFRRKPVMIITDIGRALLLMVVPIAALAALLSKELLFFVAFATSTLTVFFGVAYQSYLPSLVGRERLIDGNSKLEASTSAALMAGPGLAGVLVQVLTAPIAIVLDAASFVVSAVFLGLIRQPEAAPEKSAGEGSNIWKEIGEGLNVVFCHPLLRPLTLFMGTANLFVTVVWTILPLYIVRDLAMSPALYGVIVAVGTGASLPGALLSEWVSRRLKVGRTIVVAGVLSGASTVLLPLSSLWSEAATPLLMAGLGLSCLVITIANVSAVSLRQAVTSDRLLGRVNATSRVIIYGAPLLGALIAGVMGDQMGLPMALLVGAIGQTLATLWLVFSPVRAVRELPRSPEATLGERA